MKRILAVLTLSLTGCAHTFRLPDATGTAPLFQQAPSVPYLGDNNGKLPGDKDVQPADQGWAISVVPDHVRNYTLVEMRTDTQIVVALSDAEYAHLQSLRQAVADEEKRLVGKYGGVDSITDPCPQCPMTSLRSWSPAPYEFHGQFLLIDIHYSK